MSVVHQLGQRLFTAINQVAVQPSPFQAPQLGRARVIAVAAQKGGVGKTTSAVHLAAGLAQFHGLRVLLIDLDAQGHVASSLRAHMRASAPTSVSSVLLGLETDLQAAVVPTHVDGLHVTGADKRLAETESQMATKIGREMLLARALKTARQSYDAIVLDCPPNLGLLTLNALCAADQVLIPCDLSVLSLEGVDALVQTLQMLEQNLGRAPAILGLLHTRVDKRNHKQNAAIRRAVAQRYGNLPLQSEIGTNTAVSAAQLHGQTVFAAQPESTGARDYAQLATEVYGKLFQR